MALKIRVANSLSEIRLIVVFLGGFSWKYLHLFKYGASVHNKIKWCKMIHVADLTGKASVVIIVTGVEQLLSYTALQSLDDLIGG